MKILLAPSDFLDREIPRAVLADFQSDDPAEAIQFKIALALKDRVPVFPRHRDKDLFFHNAGRLGPAQILQ